MKKTVTANISGIIFNMDDDAYEKFQNYLQAVKSHFNASEGRDEIMSDIEARVAEMFQQRVTDRKQVITIADVERVIEAMGKPEDFAGSETEGTPSQKERAHQGRPYRRLYRDPDDRVLGGVCAGIGHYFGFDPLWLRLAFAVSLFVFGSGFLFYLLLWVIVPQARNAAEKLEMKGEKVNIGNISKSIEEEMDYLKKKLNDLKEDAKNIKTKPVAQKAENIFEKIVNFFGEVFSALFKGFLRLTGAVLLAIGIAFLILFCISLFGGVAVTAITSENIDVQSLSGLAYYFFDGTGQIATIKIGAILLFGIPVLMMIYEGFKLLFRVKTRSHALGFIAFAVWVAGWIICGVVASRLARDFSKKGISKENIALMQPAHGALYLSSVADSGNSDRDEEKNLDININNHRLIFKEGDRIFLGYVRFNIIKSRNDSFQLEVTKISRGPNRKIAGERAQAIVYNFTQQDSVLTLNPFFSIDKTNKWRGQDLKITLKVPEGKSVYLNRSMEDIIYDIDNSDNSPDEDMPGKMWKMTESGLVMEP